MIEVANWVAVGTVELFVVKDGSVRSDDGRGGRPGSGLRGFDGGRSINGENTRAG